MKRVEPINGPWISLKTVMKLFKVFLKDFLKTLGLIWYQIFLLQFSDKSKDPFWDPRDFQAHAVAYLSL